MEARSGEQAFRHPMALGAFFDRLGGKFLDLFKTRAALWAAIGI
jgi:hypothetical protein